MQISDEAVEAAARVMYAQSWAPTSSWEDVRLEFCGLMRASLEAAAPYLMAQAFDEGKRACDMEWEQTADLVTPDEHRFVASNPYRSQA